MIEQRLASPISTAGLLASTFGFASGETFWQIAGLIITVTVHAWSERQLARAREAQKNPDCAGCWSLQRELKITRQEGNEFIDKLQREIHQLRDALDLATNPRPTPPFPPAEAADCYPWHIDTSPDHPGLPTYYWGQNGNGH